MLLRLWEDQWGSGPVVVISLRLQSGDWIWLPACAPLPPLVNVGPSFLGGWVFLSHTEMVFRSLPGGPSYIRKVPWLTALCPSATAPTWAPVGDSHLASHGHSCLLPVCRVALGLHSTVECLLTEQLPDASSCFGQRGHCEEKVLGFEAL